MTQRISVVGLGKLGGAIFRGLERASFSPKAYRRVDDQRQLGQDSDMIFLCMRPHDLEDYLRSNASQFTEQTLLVSVCAGVGIERMERALGKAVPVAMVVMNTAVELGAGICAYVSGSYFTKEKRDALVSVLSCMGLCLEIQESQSAATMVLAGSAPAFVYQAAESLMDAGIHIGLPAAMAQQLATYVLKGSAIMMEHSGKSPTQLRQQVATPGGVTVEGLAVLEECAVRSAYIRALSASLKKIKGL